MQIGAGMSGYAAAAPNFEADEPQSNAANGVAFSRQKEGFAGCRNGHDLEDGAQIRGKEKGPRRVPEGLFSDFSLIWWWYTYKIVVTKPHGVTILHFRIEKLPPKLPPNPPRYPSAFH